MPQQSSADRGAAVCLLLQDLLYSVTKLFAGVCVSVYKRFSTENAKNISKSATVRKVGRQKWTVNQARKRYERQAEGQGDPGP